jgi:hypothetical protein
LNGFDEDAVGSYELAAVVLEARQQLGPALFRNRLVLGRESLGVMLEALYAKDLCPHRLLVG